MKTTRGYRVIPIKDILPLGELLGRFLGAAVMDRAD
jgi:hypothetical protein